MPLATTYTAALIGAEGHVVQVEAEVADGLPATVLVGLPDTALREARDRIRAALLNSGQDWPRRKITISLAPANLPKRGGGFDLAIAVALVAADEAVPVTAPRNVMFLSELSLDGRLRPVPGVLPAVIAAADGGIDTIVVATENKMEAELVPGVRVVSAENLAQVVDWLRDGTFPVLDPPAPSVPSTPGRAGPDFRDYPGPPQARLAAEICAAGGHNLSITGPPHAGKLALAERLPGILPDLGHRDALEVATLYSTAGLLADRRKQFSRPPFLRPHHTCSVPAMIGGGSPIRPGAASLAHRGILLVEDAPEFSRQVLDELRQPLETGEVTVARAGYEATFPAQFQLVVTARPCPCNKASDDSCNCTPAQRHRYLGRLSGPITDHIDVKISLGPTSSAATRQSLRSAESSSTIVRRVTEARQRSARRLDGTPWRLNAEIPGAELRRAYAPEAGALRKVEHTMELGKLSPRGVDKILTAGLPLRRYVAGAYQAPSIPWPAREREVTCPELSSARE